RPRTPPSLFPYTTLFRSLAQHADAVRIVDVQRGLLRARDPRKLPQRRDIAVHREHAVAGEQRGAVGMRCQLARSAVGIGMRIALDRKSTRLNSSHVKISY